MKEIAVALVIAGGIIGGAILVSSAGSSSTDSGSTTVDIKDGANVTVNNGVQVIEIRAKGGYQPRRSVAKAGLPTTIRFDSTGTFDCSASVRIPSLRISKLLPSSGTTNIDIGTPAAGTLSGTCGMGMYSFQIEFKG